MSGLERMIQLILEDGEAVSRQILSDAGKEEQQVQDQAQKEGEKIRGEMLSQAQAALEKEQQQAQAGADRLLKRQVLQTKQEIIEGILKEAEQAFSNLPEKQYWQWMEEHVNSLLKGEDGILYCRKQDIEGMSASFQNRIKELAVRKGGSLQIQPAPWPVEAGFVLRYGQVIENCTLPALLENRRQELEDMLNRYLFAKEADGRVYG